MKDFTPNLFLPLFFFVLTSLPAYAGPPETVMPALYYMFEPSVKKCSQFGHDWQLRVKDVLTTAKLNTKNLLPGELWDSLIQVSTNNETKSISISERDDCEKLVQYYSDSQFANHFRGQVVYSLMSNHALKCMLWFPTLEDELKKSWIAAFMRNGFELDESRIDYGLDNWRQRGIKPQPLSDNQLVGCKELIADFSEAKFDVAFSEKNIKKFLSKE